MNKKLRWINIDQLFPFHWEISYNNIEIKSKMLVSPNKINKKWKKIVI